MLYIGDTAEDCVLLSAEALHECDWFVDERRSHTGREDGKRKHGKEDDIGR